jgi:hypothetical protein
VYTSKTKGRNEPETFTSKFTSRETSSLEESLRSIKVYEGKCKDKIGVSFLFDVSYFIMKASGATFATNSVVLGVKIVP